MPRLRKEKKNKYTKENSKKECVKKHESWKWWNRKGKSQFFGKMKKETHRHRQTTVWLLPEGRGGGVVKGKGGKNIVMEDDETLGGGHIMQYSDYES